jgi:hypothetical protein
MEPCAQGMAVGVRECAFHLAGIGGIAAVDEARVAVVLKGRLYVLPVGGGAGTAAVPADLVPGPRQPGTWTYVQRGAVCTLGSPTVVVGSQAGTLHAWRLEAGAVAGKPADASVDARFDCNGLLAHGAVVVAAHSARGLVEWDLTAFAAGGEAPARAATHAIDDREVGFSTAGVTRDGAHVVATFQHGVFGVFADRELRDLVTGFSQPDDWDDQHDDMPWAELPDGVLVTSYGQQAAFVWHTADMPRGSIDFHINATEYAAAILPGRSEATRRYTSRDGPKWEEEDEEEEEEEGYGGRRDRHYKVYQHNPRVTALATLANGLLALGRSDGRVETRMCTWPYRLLSTTATGSSKPIEQLVTLPGECMPVAAGGRAVPT